MHGRNCTKCSGKIELVRYTRDWPKDNSHRPMLEYECSVEDCDEKFNTREHVK